MPKFFQTVDKIKPAYDITYKIVLFICKLLLTADLVITSVCVVGRYVPFGAGSGMERGSRSDTDVLHGSIVRSTCNQKKCTYPYDGI